MPQFYDYRNILNQIHGDTSATSLDVAEVKSEVVQIHQTLYAIEYILIIGVIVLPIIRSIFRKR